MKRLDENVILAYQHELFKLGIIKYDTNSSQLFIWINNSPYIEIHILTEELFKKWKDSNAKFCVIEIQGDKYICDAFMSLKKSFIKILETINPAIKELTFSLKKGDKILILECEDIMEEFIIDESQTLTISGDTLQKDMNSNYWWVSGYKVTALAIGKAKRKNYRTYTDIGGRRLDIIVNGEQRRIGHLHNGFGDGEYTFRFQGNSIVR